MIEKSLSQLQIAVCDELYRRIISEKASSSDMANAIRFLKDNGIILQISMENKNNITLNQEIPSQEDLDYLLGENI